MTQKHSVTEQRNEDAEFLKPSNIVPTYSFSRSYVFEPPVKRNWKDLTEIIKNLASVLALIAAGAWTVIQWDTIFPKTIADVQKAAASVRTDVAGSLTIQVGIPELVSEDLQTTPEAAQTKPPESADEFCAANMNGAIVKSSPVTGQIVIKSASGIPVLAKVENVQFELSGIPHQGQIGSAQPTEGAIRVIAPSSRQSIDDGRIFFGGLRENRIETGQEVKIAFLFDADIPIPCNQSLGALVIFRTSVLLKAIDPVSSEVVANEVRKVFISACQVDVRTGAHCNIDTFEAYGQ